LETWEHLWFYCQHWKVEEARAVLSSTLTTCYTVEDVLTRLEDTHQQITREKELVKFIQELQL
jgi:hypothetical protein